jgi:hypothetical protein
MVKMNDRIRVIQNRWTTHEKKPSSLMPYRARRLRRAPSGGKTPQNRSEAEGFAEKNRA